MSKASMNKAKPRLGRGLSSLISVSDLPVEAEIPQPASAALDLAARSSAGPITDDQKTKESTPVAATISSEPTGHPREIPLESIVPNPHQPRRKMDESRLAELASSLRSTGLIQPVIVRQVDGEYQLIAGERRWRAAKIAGLKAIPAFIREVDGFAQAQMALIENIQREDLNPIDRAMAYRALVDQLGLTQSELANRLGEERSSIANFLRLLDLAESVKDHVRDGTLSLGHAKLLAGVSDVLEQQRLAELAIAQDLSVRNLERLLQDGTTSLPTPSRTPPSAHLQDLERSLTRQLGMRVQVKGTSKKGKGRLVIHYSSLDQFDELLGKLGIASE